MTRSIAGLHSKKRETTMGHAIKVGDTFTHQRTCDPYRPLYYAAASGDFNPIHIDAEAGKAAGLGGNILQGLCTLGWAVEGFGNFLGDPGKVTRVRVRFSRPVAVGDVVTYLGKVTAVEGGKCTVSVSAKNQKDEDVLKGALLEGRI
jgi:acyl dehydratase